MINANVKYNRDYYLGGSDVRQILDRVYFTSVYNFALYKLGMTISVFDGNVYTRYGEIMEPIIRQVVNDFHGYNFVEYCIKDDDRKFRGNLDGIDFERKTLLEIKTCGSEININKYYDQVQFYLELAEYDSCLLAVYQRPEPFYNGISYSINKSDCYFDTTFYPENLHFYEIKRDKKYFKTVNATLIKFQKALEMLRLNTLMTIHEFNEAFYGKKIVNQIMEIKRLQQKISQMKKIERKLNNSKHSLFQKFEKMGIKHYSSKDVKARKIDPSDITKKGTVRLIIR